MYKLTDTGYRDRNREIIYMGSTVANIHGDTYLIVLDTHLGYALDNRVTSMIEKLNQFICGDLIVIEADQEKNALAL